MCCGWKWGSCRVMRKSRWGLVMIVVMSNKKDAPLMSVLPWKIRARSRFCVILKLSSSPAFGELSLCCWLESVALLLYQTLAWSLCVGSARLWATQLLGHIGTEREKTGQRQGQAQSWAREASLVHLELCILRPWRNQKLFQNNQPASQSLMGLHWFQILANDLFPG